MNDLDPIVYMPVVYFNNFLQGTQDMCLATLLKMDWVQAGEKAPRKEYYVHDDGKPYTYGSGEFARTYQSQPTNSVIEYIRRRLNLMNGSTDGVPHKPYNFNVVFLNLYEHAHHHLGWHADDSPEMNPDHPIVTVSLGAEREIWFRSYAEKERVAKLRLGHGSMAMMLSGMQQTHQHRIPKSDRGCGPRVSLTFRNYIDVNA